MDYFDQGYNKIIDAKFPNQTTGTADNLRFASAKIVNHTPFSASGAWRASIKIDIKKGSVLKTVPKATFFASTRLISFC